MSILPFPIRRSLVAALLGLAALGGCGEDVAGPDPMPEEDRLARQLEQADFQQCLTEFNRFRSGFVSLPPDELLAELRRIVQVCFETGGGTTLGAVEVDVTTSGDDIDPDGYVVRVGAQSDGIASTGSARIENVVAGATVVELDDVADNCVVSGGVTRTVTVPPGGTALVSFAVLCSADAEAGVLPGEIADDLESLVPDGGLRDAIRDRILDILDLADGGDADGARAEFIELIRDLLQSLENGELVDPNDAAPPTIEGALVDLIQAVADAAGQESPPLDEASFDADAAVAVIDEDGGTLVTGSGFAGVMLPPGSLDGATLFVVTRLPVVGDPSDRDGPLPTELDQYPLFYDVSTYPEGATLATDGVVGVCVVDPPDPFAPDPAIVDRLRLAHPDPDDPTVIDILPLAPAPFLDCDGAASGGLTPASPGRLGASVGAFSPFGAVDTGSGEASTGLIVTLDWSELTDMDLHLLRGADTDFFDVDDDCFFSNCLETSADRVDWGPTGPAGDPLLENDALRGGREVIRVGSLEPDRQYRVGIHAFSGSSAAARITVFLGTEIVECDAVALTSPETVVVATIDPGTGVSCEDTMSTTAIVPAGAPAVTKP